jgi:hypothetical protein
MPTSFFMSGHQHACSLNPKSYFLLHVWSPTCLLPSSCQPLLKAAINNDFPTANATSGLSSFFSTILLSCMDANMVPAASAAQINEILYCGWTGVRASHLKIGKI